MEPKFEPKKYAWFRVKTQIDLMEIDEEVSQMPTLLQDAGELTCSAIEARDSSKELLSQVRSEIAAELRATKTESGKPKSETQIESEIELSSKFKEQQDLLSQARQDAGLWINLMEALRTKAAQLRTAADLISSGYITRDYISNKRRDEIRKARPPMNLPQRDPKVQP